MYSYGDVAQRLVLFAVFDDGAGHRQWIDVIRAIEAYRGELWLRQVRAVRRIHCLNSDACLESGFEWIGASILWLGVGPNWTLRHDGDRLRTRSNHDHRLDVGRSSSFLVHRDFRVDVLCLGRYLLAVSGSPRGYLRRQARNHELRNSIYGERGGFDSRRSRCGGTDDRRRLMGSRLLGGSRV